MSLANGAVLIVEDDSTLRRTLHTTLAALDFDIGEASSGEEALRRLCMIDYDVVLLDINMPGLNGVEACRHIRSSYPRLPILMLTVRDSEDDKVQALESGADDYITKPFKIRELIARIRSAVRRYRTHQAPPEAPLVIGHITLDPVRRRVQKAGVSIHLTPQEFNALRYLMENAGKPLTHDMLAAKLWGPGFSERRENLRVMISNLRMKLEDDAATPDYLLTESYIGYRFRDK
jgi:two-component system KDP operon response regulator KdpE